MVAGWLTGGVLLQTRLQAQAAGVPYYQAPQMAALGPDAVLTNLLIPSQLRAACHLFGASFCFFSPYQARVNE